MSMGIDLRDQFDNLLEEAMEDSRYEKFVEYILERVAYYSQARTMQAVEVDKGFWRVSCRDGAGTMYVIPKAMISVTAFRDDHEAHSIFALPSDNKL